MNKVYVVLGLKTLTYLYVMHTLAVVSLRLKVKEETAEEKQCEAVVFPDSRNKANEICARKRKKFRREKI